MVDSACAASTLLTAADTSHGACASACDPAAPHWASCRLARRLGSERCSKSVLQHRNTALSCLLPGVNGVETPSHNPPTYLISEKVCAYKREVLSFASLANHQRVDRNCGFSSSGLTRCLTRPGGGSFFVCILNRHKKPGYGKPYPGNFSKPPRV